MESTEPILKNNQDIISYRFVEIVVDEFRSIYGFDLDITDQNHKDIAIGIFNKLRKGNKRIMIVFATVLLLMNRDTFLI